jgi:hypothetical protein
LFFNLHWFHIIWFQIALLETVILSEARFREAKSRAVEGLQGILTMIEFAGELPAAAVELPVLQGSFDCEIASLRMTTFHSSSYRWHVLQLVMSPTLRTLYSFTSAEPKST